MKIILNVLLLILVGLGTAEAQFVRKWEKSATLGNLPSWFSSTNDKVRGMTFTVQNNGPRLLVITDKQAPSVIILDALTGDSVGTLNTYGISGGEVALNDLTSLSNYYGDSRIIGCNLTLDASITPFKVYVWQDIYSQPQIIVVDSISTIRLGEHINGCNYFTNDTIHLVTASPGTNKIIDYKLSSSLSFLESRVSTLNNIILGMNASADYSRVLGFSEWGGYYVNSDGTYPTIYTNGLPAYVDSTVGVMNNAIKFYSNGTLCCDNPFFVTYNYANNYASLSTWNIIWGATSSMGNNPNPTNYGDVDYVWRTNDSLLVFVLAGNNGIGAYYANGFYLPVELISFTAESNNSYIILNWITASETNNKGFEIQKFIDDKWKNIGFMEGKGTTTEKQTYSFTDKNLEPGRYIYRLKQTDYDGSYEYSNEIEAVIELPYEFALQQNYPNPFNPTTTISYSLPTGINKVRLSIYDMLGKEIVVLVNEEKPAGEYQVEWDASAYSSGVYFYRLQAGEFTSTKKLLLMK